MPADAKHMFGGADVVLREMRKRNKRKSGLLLPKRNKNNKGRDVKYDYPTEDSFYDRVSKTYKRLEELKGNVDIREHKNRYISISEIGRLMTDIKGELILLYNDDDANEVSIIHKEGQLYAYKLLLKLIDKQ